MRVYNYKLEKGDLIIGIYTNWGLDYNELLAPKLVTSVQRDGAHNFVTCLTESGHPEIVDYSVTSESQIIRRKIRQEFTPEEARSNDPTVVYFEIEGRNT